MEDDLFQCFASLPSFIARLDESFETIHLNEAESLGMRCEEYLELLRVLMGRVGDLSRTLVLHTDVIDCQQLLADIDSIVSSMCDYAEHFIERTMALQDEVFCFESSATVVCPRIRNGPGRPTYWISSAQIESLIEVGYTYTRISRMFGVSERTLLRRREELGMQIGRPFSAIDDDELDATVRSILDVSLLSKCLQDRYSDCI